MAPGDEEFLRALHRLPEPIGQAGEELLRRIRAEFPGELRFHPKSGKYVNRPDNFVVFRVQPRAKSLRITIRGIPSSHSAPRSVVLRPDMGSYSVFTLEKPGQLEDAFRVIREAGHR